MVFSRYQIAKKLGGVKVSTLTSAGPYQNKMLWRPQTLRQSCSRRKALKFLGISTTTALVSAGCQGSSAVIAPTGQSLKAKRLKTVKVDAEGQITAEPSINITYFDEPILRQELRQVLPLRMVKIPAGEFLMGSPATETHREEQEGPQRSIQIPSFYMGAFAITQRQYMSVMGNNPSYFTDEQDRDGADLPAEQITWRDASAFCQQLSDLTGRIYRLPSEAEWEYACRAGTTTPFCFGEKLTTEIANFFADFSFTENIEENYRNASVAVDSFWPNPFGLYNMHGNIYEWCADDYHDSYQDAPSDGSLWLSDQANASKIMRGGAWFNDTPYCRSAARERNSQTGLSNSFGFRIVCEENS